MGLVVEITSTAAAIIVQNVEGFVKQFLQPGNNNNLLRMSLDETDFHSCHF